MRGFDFVPIRSDLMLIVLSGNRPLTGCVDIADVILLATYLRGVGTSVIRPMREVKSKMAAKIYEGLIQFSYHLSHLIPVFSN